MNKVILIGRIGNDPELNYVQPENPVANFSLATSESYKNQQGERVENTEWHNIEVWGKLAEVAGKHFKKGELLMVEGKIKTNTYEKNGEKRYSTKIQLKEFQFLSPKN